MELELQIIRDPYRDESKQRIRVFGRAGGIVGRAHDSFWVLPDPRSFLSGHHCEILYRNDAFWVRDISRNGLFLNDEQEPLGYGHRAELHDGDHLRLAYYELRVRLRDRSHESRHGRSRAPVLDEPAPVERPQHAHEATGEHEALVVDTHAEASSDDRANMPDEFAATQVLDIPSATLAPEPAEAVEPAEAGQLSDLHEAAAESATESEQVDDASHLQTQVIPQEWVPTPAAVGRIVQIDRAALQSTGMLPPEDQERLVANQFRHIKRSLMASAFGKGTDPVKNGRIMMVASALPGEGKTFNSINLAFSLAREKGVEVVLVDADVAKRDVSRNFGLAGEPGLMDVLADESRDVESLILRTSVDNLCILPAGHSSEEEATELLASSRMEDVVAQIMARHPKRVVLLDSPPLLITNEALVIATIAGQIVLVVRAGVTPQAAVLEAVSLLNDEKPIGLILNQSTVGAKGGYGYGYGYAYGYGTDGDKPGEVVK